MRPLPSFPQQKSDSPFTTALPPIIPATQISVLPALSGQPPEAPLAVEAGTLRTLTLPSLVTPTGSSSLSLHISDLPPVQPLFIVTEALTTAAQTTPLTTPVSGFFTPATPITSPLSYSLAEGITKPQASAETLIAKVSGIIKGDATKGDIPVVKLDNIAAAIIPSGDKPATQPLFILHMPESSALLPLGTELALSPLTSSAENLTTITANATTVTPSSGTITTPLPWPSYAIPALTPQIWPALDQIYQGLVTIAPQTAMNLVNVTARPDNPAQMMPAALFFIAAIRSGDVQGWLGEKALEGLKSSGKSGLLSRLTQEGGILSRLSGEHLSGDWRGVAFPLAWQNEIHKIALYYKHEEREDSELKEASKARVLSWIFR
ncbi:MAG: hypothetical protein LRY54_01555 [Alphaproteobacteria bacterium]|nr:hypothetical protein [Alphaproteobacteria bacterium]